jgi:hypothetical protein
LKAKNEKNVKGACQKSLVRRLLFGEMNSRVYLSNIISQFVVDLFSLLFLKSIVGTAVHVDQIRFKLLQTLGPSEVESILSAGTGV